MSALSEISIRFPGRRVVPIPFSTDMSRAIKLRLKTQTRRLVTFPKSIQNPTWSSYDFKPEAEGLRILSKGAECWKDILIKPRYRVGDVLYITETFCPVRHGSYEPLPKGTPLQGPQDAFIQFRADYHGPSDYDGHWRGGRFMPRWMARQFVEVTAVKPQRIQDISEQDAIAEGIGVFKPLEWDDGQPHRIQFVKLWHKIHAKGPFAAQWEANPWIFAHTFRRIAL